jgi:hypothetical protein
MQAARKFSLGLGLAALLVSTTLARQADPAPETTKWLAKDAEVVMILNIKQLFASKAMAKGGLEAIKAAIAGNDQARSVTEATGIDPTKDLDMVIISGTMPANPKDARALIVVKGRFNQDKIQSAAEKFAKSNPDELKLVKEDGKQLYQIKTNNDQTLLGGFIDSTTLVLTTSKEATLDAIKNGGKKAVKVSKVLQPVLEKFTGKESLALAVAINDELKKNLEKAPQARDIAAKLQSVNAALTIDDGATLKAAINTEDAASAKKTRDLLNQLKGLGELLAGSDEMFGPAATEVLKALKIMDQDSSVQIELVVTKEMIEKAHKKDK